MTSLAATYGGLAPGRPSRTVWAGAALMALALHAGLILAAIWALQPDEFDDDTGAPAIELAMDMAAPKTAATDLPPGPESEASAASPESARATPKAETADRPKDDPVESDTPDRVVSPEVARKPDREPDKTKPQPSEASTASVASEAMSAPAQETTAEGRVAVAPTIGAGQNAQQVRANWQKRLLAHLNRHKRYPAGVRQRTAENRVVFTLDRLGHVVSARVSASSGDGAFDAAALEMMKRSDPVPAPPALIADETLTFEVPVVFRAPPR